MKQKSEAITKGKSGDDIATEQNIKWRDKTNISSVQNKNKKFTNRRLRDLEMGSHRVGTVKDEKRIIATENIDQSTTTYKVIKTYGKQLVGYREVDKLRRVDEIEWIIMSEVDYATQLVIGLPANKKPKRAPLVSGGQVFLDPDVFCNLVKNQEEHNNTKLTISFDRSPKKLARGNLYVVVANPKNPDHDYPGRAAERDNDWTRRMKHNNIHTGGKGV